jgi:hypothetical protein
MVFVKYLGAVVLATLAMCGTALADPASMTAMAASMASFASAAGPYALIGGTLLSGAGTAMSFASQKRAASDAKLSAMMEMAASRRAAEAEQAMGAEALKTSTFRARQLDMKAQEERAAGSAKASEVRKQKELAMSKLIARAAAGGGAVQDNTVVALAEGLEKEGEMRALTEFYLGESAARGDEDAAMGERLTGEAAYKGAVSRKEGTLAAARANNFTNLARARGLSAGATATLVSGAGSIFDRFAPTKKYG